MLFHLEFFRDMCLVLVVHFCKLCLMVFIFFHFVILHCHFGTLNMERMIWYLTSLSINLLTISLCKFEKDTF